MEQYGCSQLQQPPPFLGALQVCSCESLGQKSFIGFRAADFGFPGSGILDFKLFRASLSVGLVGLS